MSALKSTVKSALKCGQRLWKLCFHGLCSLTRALVPVLPNTTWHPAVCCSVQIRGWHPQTSTLHNLDQQESKERLRNELITCAHGHGKPKVISVSLSPAGVAANSCLFIILKVCVCLSILLAVVILNQLPALFESCCLKSQTAYKRQTPPLRSGHIVVPASDSLPKVQQRPVNV